MPDRPSDILIRLVHNVLRPQSASGVDDSRLLERWVAQRDEAAFEVLLWRHGPMVLSLCRRLLRDPPEVEDAFQATFLMFVRKAGTIRQRESVGSWLYKVAYRVAIRARSIAGRRRQRERPEVDVPVFDLGANAVWRDLRPVLDEEVHRLPERYRSPFVLCCLQGRTNAEAAVELGCPVGTILSRLAWARNRLRRRLQGRGITLGSTGLALLLAGDAARASVPPTLARSTLKAGLGYVAGNLQAGSVSPGVISLAEGVMRTMFLKKWQTAAVAVLFLGLLSSSGLYHVLSAQEPAEPPRVSKPVAVKHAPVRNVARVVSAQEGILVFIGTPVSASEKVPEESLGSATLDSEKIRYRKLREGDVVKEGQILGRLDDRLAQNDVEIAEAKVAAAKADVRASETTRTEARQRYETKLKLLKTGGNALLISQEEISSAKLTWERFSAETTSKEQAVVVADLELKRARTVLRSYEIRSRVHGVITAINKQPGEAVRKLEPVFLVKVERQ
jgi:RNA polymerase sigma factor (sigma-70 family)